MEIVNERPDIKQFVENVAKQEGIKFCTITHVETNKKGEGFLGQIFMVTVKDENSEKKLEVVVKAAFNNQKVREHVPIRNCFLNEICFYTEIYPMFKNFEQECGISKGSQFIPKCFQVLADNNTELLCLENLKASNFELFNKTDGFDDKHVSLIFKTYGRFHAYSFALKQQRLNAYENIASKLHDIYTEFINNSGAREYLKYLSGFVEKFLVPGEDDEVIAKFMKYTGDGILEIYSKIINEKHDYLIISHGDCWSNNMMFKYEYLEKTKNPIDMFLLDFQVARLASPVFDLSYCLYSGASKEVLDNLEKYLKIYHKSLSSFLRELRSDPEEFPYEILKDQWKTYSKFGMIKALSIIKIKLTKKEDISDYLYEADEMHKSAENMKFDEEEYRKKVRELLHHMSDIGAL